MSSIRFTVTEAFERSRRRLWALCYRMTGNRAEADDLVQEAAIRALERADQLAGADPTGWLITLTTRLCLDHLRRRENERRAAARAEEPEPARGAEDALLMRGELEAAVIVALPRLSLRQRAALLLHEAFGWPLKDVAAALQINANAAKALLHRARAALLEARDALGEKAAS